MLRRRQELIPVGYWAEPGFVSSLLTSLPQAEDYVDPSWDDSPERPVVIAYLKKGKAHKRWMGWSNCRLCGKRNGTKCLTDGLFVWPEGLAHYVEDHSLKPNQAFVDHILRGGRRT